MTAGYIILGDGRGSDFGSCSLITPEIWEVISGHRTLCELDEMQLMEIGEVLASQVESIKEEIDNLSDEMGTAFDGFQEMHQMTNHLFHAEKKITCALFFPSFTKMINYVRVHNIEILGTQS